jgi:hypothetical protein
VNLENRGRAVTTDAKKAVIARLLDVWLQNPDLRLGQLVGDHGGYLDLYNMEDFPLIASIEELRRSMKEL